MAEDACDAARTGADTAARGWAARGWAARSWAARRDGGFTLLEVLVAFIILSLALVALLRGGVDGLGGVRAAGQVEDAVALARSHLSSFDALAAPTGEDLQGDEGGGYHWRLHVTPLASLPPGAAGRGRAEPTALYRVSVTISWQAEGRARSVHLETQRLTPVRPQRP